jgi:signal transduction histidine kinase
MHMVVRDDGIGFDVAAARERAESGASLGLPGMPERVTLLGRVGL